MQNPISIYFNGDSWGRILQHIDETNEKVDLEHGILNGSFEVQILHPQKQKEMSFALRDIVAISEEILKKTSDVREREVINKGLQHLKQSVERMEALKTDLLAQKGITQSLEQLKLNVQRDVGEDVAGEKVEVYLPIQDYQRLAEFYRQIETINAEITSASNAEFTSSSNAEITKASLNLESIPKSEIIDIANSRLVQEVDIQQVINLIKKDKNLLFELSEYHESFFDFIVEKCSQELLLPLLSEVINEIAKLEQQNLAKLKSFLFSRIKNDSFFELLMKGPEANLLFNCLLKVMTETELNESINTLRKKQILFFAYSKRRYEYIFLKVEDLSEETIRLSNHYANTLRMPFSSTIRENYLNSTKYYDWLKMRRESSATLTESSSVRAASAQRWNEAEDLRSQFVQEQRAKKGPIKWYSIQQLHFTLCNGEKGINEPGQTRKDIVRTSGGWTHLYCPDTFLLENLRAFMPWLNAGLGKCDLEELSPIILAAQTYQRLVSYHPFENGNGRLSRLIGDWVLELYGLPPPILGKDILDAVFPLDSVKAPQDNFVRKIIKGIEESKKILES